MLVVAFSHRVSALLIPQEMRDPDTRFECNHPVFGPLLQRPKDD